jgi:hypothetical protein
MRSGGYGGDSLTGLQRSAPTSNSSFCTLDSSAAMPGGRSPKVIAIPIAQLASSTSAYAASRESVLAVRLPSPSAVVPSSPVRV